MERKGLRMLRKVDVCTTAYGGGQVGESAELMLRERQTDAGHQGLDFGTDGV